MKQGQARASAENKAREDRFSNDKANQAAALKRAEDERTREERRSARLEKKFEENELLIAAKQEQLRERLGTLSELFGHLTAASGDLASNVEVSLVSSEYPGREGFLKALIAKMSGSDQLPSIAEIERVWFELLREIREQGEVSRFTAQVATPRRKGTRRHTAPADRPAFDSASRRTSERSATMGAASEDLEARFWSPAKQALQSHILSELLSDLI